jgi:hypothetical protein
MGLPLVVIALCVFGGPVGWYVGYALYVHAAAPVTVKKNAP